MEGLLIMCVFEQYNEAKINLSLAKEVISRLSMMGADVGDEQYDKAIMKVRALAYEKAKLASASHRTRRKFRDCGHDYWA